MSYLISAILLFANFISSLLKDKVIIPKVLLVMMWVLFWGNYDNADYFNYKYLYDVISQTGKGFETTQLGFGLIMKIMSGFGLEYYQFLMLVSFLGLLLITSSVKRYSSKPQLVYLLYFIHPFLLDIVQLKHFLAMAIVVFCLRYLEHGGIKNSIKFIIGILAASSIHYISLFFIPFLFLKKMKIKHLYMVVLIVLIIGIPIAYTNIFQNMAAYIVPQERVESFFSNRAKYGFFIQFFIQSIILIMVYFSKRFLKKHEVNDRFVELVYKINVYLLILFPLYIINGTFERAFRMTMIPNYIVFSLVISKINRKEKGSLLILLLIFVIALFIYYIFLPSRETVFFPIFKNNLIFN